MQPFQKEPVASYSAAINRSFQRWTGKPLVTPQTAETLYQAPLVVVSHGLQKDPIFCYANLAAQKLWNMPWETFTTLPSRLSAEPDAHEARDRLLALAEAQGFVDNYEGVRITSDGKRFMIKHCILWNVLDEQARRIGQAACFSEWVWL